MKFNNILFRCSQLGYLMTEPRSKSAKEAGELSETTKTHLIDVFVQNKYGRRSDIKNKYITKGLMVEEDSITLFSRISKTFFKKNEEHLSNEFIKGTPDIFTGKTIHEASEIIDVKSSWDIFTFFRNLNKGINEQYYWQLQGYMALTNAKTSKLVYCLIDTPEVLIQDAKRRLLWDMNAGTEENHDYVEACKEIDALMTYSDIPLKDRVIIFDIERNNADIQRLFDKIGKCRQFLNELEISLNPDAIICCYDEENKLTMVE